jgi:hypothetical protein
MLTINKCIKKYESKIYIKKELKFLNVNEKKFCKKFLLILRIKPYFFKGN